MKNDTRRRKTFIISAELIELLHEMQQSVRFNDSDDQPSQSQIVEQAVWFFANEMRKEVEEQTNPCTCKQIEH